MSTMPPITDPRFDPNYSEEEPSKPKRSVWANCLVGCLVVFAILVVLAAIAIYWIMQNWREWTASFGTPIVKQAIATSALPEQEKIDINIQIDRLATAFREGRLSSEQWATFMHEMIESPLLTSFMVSAIDQRYLNRSGLSAEEKAEGRITLQRFLRGMIDEKIDQQGIDRALAHVAVRKSDGTWELRQNLTDDELKAFLTTAKAEADQAGIPEEPPEFDPSDEFKRIVDQALGEQSVELEVPPVEIDPDDGLPNDVTPDASAEPSKQRPERVGEEEQANRSGGA